MNFGSIPFVARATPSGGGGSIAYVGAGAQYVQYSSQTTHVIDVPAGMSVGDYLVLALPAPAISSVVASNSQALSSLVSNNGSIWGVQIAGSVPTSVTVTLSSAAEYRGQALAFSGPTAVAGTADEDVIGIPRDTMNYVSDATNAAVVCVYVAPPREVTAATFNGSNAANHLSKFPFADQGVVAGIHDGATGTSSFAVTWSSTDGGGRYISVALKA